MKKKHSKLFVGIIIFWLVVVIFIIKSIFVKDTFEARICTPYITETYKMKYNYDRSYAKDIYSKVEQTINSTSVMMMNNRNCFVKNDIGYSVDFKNDEKNEEITIPYGRLFTDEDGSYVNLYSELKKTLLLSESNLELIKKSEYNNPVKINDKIMFEKRKEDGYLIVYFSLIGSIVE